MEQINGKARWLRMRREEKTLHNWIDSKDRREREALKIEIDEQLKAHEIFVDRVWNVSVAIVAIILLSIIIPGITQADTEIDLMTVQGENNG